MITKAQAEFIYGNSISDEQLADLNSCLNRFEINTSPRNSPVGCVSQSVTHQFNNELGAWGADY